MDLDTEIDQFLEKQIDENFTDIMSEYIIEEFVWVSKEELCVVAVMGQINRELPNLVCLFPLCLSKGEVSPKPDDFVLDM